MAEHQPDIGAFEVGRMFSRAFGAISANLVLFFGLALVLSGIPAFLVTWWQFGQIAPNADPEAQLALFTSLDFWGPIIAVWGVALLTDSVLQASLTRATAMHLAGQRPGFAKCLSIGLTLLLPVVAISVMIGIGVGIGLILLIVPGIILWLYWSVAIPAFVQERIGVFEAFGRSAKLTDGYRVNIFAIMLAVGIGMWVFDMVVSRVVEPIIVAATSPLPSSLLQGVIAAISSMVLVSVQTSIYVELRNVKEGVPPSELESIFA